MQAGQCLRGLVQLPASAIHSRAGRGEDALDFEGGFGCGIVGRLEQMAEVWSQQRFDQLAANSFLVRIERMGGFQGLDGGDREGVS